MTQSQYDFFIFAGENSGDLHGEKLIRSLKERNPRLKMTGVYGPKMRSASSDCILHLENCFQVMGFIDVFLSLPKLIKLFFKVRNTILQLNPKAVVFIDYPGFNLRMAKALRKKGFAGKICHYICPSVWAWGKNRISLMAKTLDLLLTILPFEAECFRETNLDVRYVGNPLAGSIKNYSHKRLSLQKKGKLIGIFPGSRLKELKRNLPLQLRAARRLLANDSSLTFALSISEPKYKDIIYKSLQAANLKIGTEVHLIPTEQTYDLMHMCDLAIAKSGTVTLELALHLVPTVVTYAVSRLDQFIALNLLRIRLPHYCLVNIICGKEIFPELIGTNLTEDTLFQQLNRFLYQPDVLTDCKEECRQLNFVLQSKDASLQAADNLLHLAHC